ncbi:putative replicase [Euprosterna elaeasa virus]|uniref:Putative replicase n=1 Tax=Euprosterna elaeasa virus TaxID=186165 RepID=Q8QYM6_9VIRU|nr:putative replicase [Euprosterna elaeasa virus]AAL78970.1 putative replicase [Euprosterna elaeasa virus]
MEASNPVIAPTRLSLEAMLEERASVVRQDLQSLRVRLEGAPRTLAPQAPEKQGRDSAQAAAKSIVTELRDAVKEAQGLEHKSLDFLEQLGEYPVCGIIHGDHPIHPSGTNNNKGKVSVQRQFTTSMNSVDALQVALRYEDVPLVRDIALKTTYTDGSLAGFVERLKLQTTRPCVQEKVSRRLLRELFPYDPQKLVDVSRELSDLVLEIKTNATASAGPPYWRSKRDALPDMLDCVLPLLYQHIVDGDLATLKNKHPELFLAECKNKTDRYEVEKLGEKTRPYFSHPFHLSALVSVLSQSFSKALKIMTEESTSYNAYGFSWTNGGAEDLVIWARGAGEVGKEPPRIACYGDDTDIYYRQKGRLYRICPDFKQMDGSVDETTIKAVVDYVVHAHTSQYPLAKGFWLEVGKLWVEMATSSPFLIDGTLVYRKKQKDGLMTGVVGTTLFDTVKSALAYKDWADQLLFGDLELLKEKKAIKFFKEKHGLVIKEGTWNPTAVTEDPGYDELWTEQKFLGLQIKVVKHADTDEKVFVPTLPYSDWLSMWVTPRARLGHKESYTMRQRTLFDRARGLLVTGAAFDKQARELMGSVINETPSEIVCMKVQEGGGRGAPPSYAFLTRDGNFEFPVSDGFPDLAWTTRLYSRDQTGDMPRVFPDAVTLIAAYRKRLMDTRIAVKEGNVSYLMEVAVAETGLNMEMPAEAVVLPPKPPSIQKPREFTYAENVSTSTGSLVVKKVDKVPDSAGTLETIFQKFMESVNKQIEELRAGQEKIERTIIMGAALPAEAIRKKMGNVDLRKTAEKAALFTHEEAGDLYLSTNPVLGHPDSFESGERAKEVHKVIGKHSTPERKAREKAEPVHDTGEFVKITGPAPGGVPTQCEPGQTPWYSLCRSVSKAGYQVTTRTEPGLDHNGRPFVRAVVLQRNMRLKPQPWQEWLVSTGRSLARAKELASDYALELVQRERYKQPLDATTSWAEDAELGDTIQLLDRGRHVFSLIGERFERVNPGIGTKHQLTDRGDLMVWQPASGTYVVVAPPRKTRSGARSRTLASMVKSVVRANVDLRVRTAGEPFFRDPVELSNLKKKINENKNEAFHESEDLRSEPEEYQRGPSSSFHEDSPRAGDEHSDARQHDRVPHVQQLSTKLQGENRLEARDARRDRREPSLDKEGAEVPQVPSGRPSYRPSLRDPNPRVQQLEEQVRSLQAQITTIAGVRPAPPRGGARKSGNMWRRGGESRAPQRGPGAPGSGGGASQNRKPRGPKSW